MNDVDNKGREPLQNAGMPQRNYKDTVFRLLFNDRARLLSLFNAVNGTAYNKPEELEIITLQNAVYMSMKNDLSFLMDFQMYLYEHQSSLNPNLPLRDLFYVARQYEKLTIGKNLYGQGRTKLPTPHFIVFYNGTGRQPETKRVRLSDAYEVQEAEKELELIVTVFNINSGYNEELKEKCPALGEYAAYVARVREHAKGHALYEAVELAVSECIREGILKDFLSANRAEVVGMSIFEYNQEEHMRMEREEAYAEGLAEGKAEGKAEGMEDGKVKGAACKLIFLVRSWIRQGLKEEEIAGLAQEPQEDMLRLIRTIKENPKADDEQILQLWGKQA